MSLLVKLEVTLQANFADKPFVVSHWRKAIYRSTNNWFPQVGMFIKFSHYTFQVQEVWDDGEYNTIRVKEYDDESIDTEEVLLNLERQLKQSGFEEYDPSAHRFQTEEAGTDYRRT